MPDSAPNRGIDDASFPTPDLLLAAIVDSSDDVIVSKNLDGIVLSASSATQRMR